MSRDEIRRRSLQLVEQWHSLVGTNDIETKADLARHLGVSRARVTKVLSQLPLYSKLNYISDDPAYTPYDFKNTCENCRHFPQAQLHKQQGGFRVQLSTQNCAVNSQSQK